METQSTHPRATPLIESGTPIVPQAIAVAVWEEASGWLDAELPRAWIVALTDRAETVYARNPRVHRLFRRPGNKGRDGLWVFMRHWLAALIRRYRPELCARLPGSYGAGQLLPDQVREKIRNGA